VFVSRKGLTEKKWDFHTPPHTLQNCQNFYFTMGMYYIYNKKNDILTQFKRMLDIVNMLVHHKLTYNVLSMKIPTGAF
jgi:hypothetical protein